MKNIERMYVEQREAIPNPEGALSRTKLPLLLMLRIGCQSSRNSIAALPEQHCPPPQLFIKIAGISSHCSFLQIMNINDNEDSNGIKERWERGKQLMRVF
jgi:hypothetical protein